MIHTCKTCAAYDDHLQGCWRAKDDCPDNKPACEYWILSAGKLMTAFRASLDKAREKHPEFIDLGQRYSDHSIEYFQDKAESLKGALERSDCQLRTLLVAEVYAFLFEFARGDFDRALEEAGDVMAVLYRALNEAGKKEQEDKE